MSDSTLNIDALSIEQRIDLIDRLWRSVSSANPALTDDQRVELDRRLDRIDREGASALSLDEMWARIDKKRR